MRKRSLQQIEELVERQFESQGASVTAEPRVPAARDREHFPSAAAFDALRKSVTESRLASQVHQAHIAELHRILNANDDVRVPRLMVGDMLRQVGLVPINDLDRAELFTDIDDGEAPPDAAYRVVEPAYLEESTGRIVRQGRIRALANEAHK